MGNNSRKRKKIKELVALKCYLGFRNLKNYNSRPEGAEQLLDTMAVHNSKGD